MNFNSDAKKKVRLEYDLPLIKRFYNKYTKKLNYFGLSGKELNDILNWKDFIEQALTVEYDPSYIPELIHNIQANNLDSKIQFLEGDIINLICSEDNTIKYPYDLINLDLVGTLIYQSQEEIIEKPIDRIEMFDKIINKQAEVLKNGQGFLFFITLNGQRGRDISIFEKAFKSLTRISNQKEISWLSSGKNNVKQYQKIAYVVFCLIHKKCINLFNLEDFKIIIYQGNKNIMIHFAFLLIKNIYSHIDFSDIDPTPLSDTEIIMIDKEGEQMKIKGDLFFTTEDPFQKFIQQKDCLV